METMQVSQVLSLFPETKTQIDVFVYKMINEIAEGEMDVLRTESHLACMECVVKSIRKNDKYKEILLNEAEKYTAKTFSRFNANFQVKEVGVKYDYSGCGHPDYYGLVKQIEELEKEKKELENQMKTHTKSWIYTDINSGEQYEVFPPVKSSTTQVVTTINK